MKNLSKFLLIALLVIPCAVLISACEKQRGANSIADGEYVISFYRGIDGSVLSTPQQLEVMRGETMHRIVVEDDRMICYSLTSGSPFGVEFVLFDFTFKISNGTITPTEMHSQFFSLSTVTNTYIITYKNETITWAFRGTNGLMRFTKS
jgi:hypothetical protein